MNTPNHEPSDVEQARERSLQLQNELEAHRSEPQTTPEWKEHEKELLGELSATEGKLVQLTAEQGIIDA